MFYLVTTFTGVDQQLEIPSWCRRFTWYILPPHAFFIDARGCTQVTQRMGIEDLR